MLKASILITFVVVAALIIAVGMDMFIVGRPLCGPICPPTGPSHWSRSCFGYVWRQNVIDSYTDYCIGIPISSRHCFTRSMFSDGVIVLAEERCGNVTPKVDW